MVERKWFRVDFSEVDSADLVSVLRDALSFVEEECFTIRRPEVHDAIDDWAERLRDGSVFCGSEVFRMMAAMIGDGGTWCEFDSESVRIHPSEMALYVGFSPQSFMNAISDSSALFESVDGSPFAADVALPEYRAATVEFWRTIENMIESDGPLVMLSQWAAGIGGEKWYLLKESDDLKSVTEDLTPRSVVVIFSPKSVLSLNPGALDIDGVVSSVDLFGDLRWLYPDTAPMLRSETVDDERDLRRKLADSNPGELLVSWPESKEDLLAIAATPDVDGIIRTALVIYQ